MSIPGIPFCAGCEKKIDQEYIPQEHGDFFSGLRDSESGHEVFYHNLISFYLYRNTSRELFKEAKFHNHSGCRNYLLQKTKQRWANLCPGSILITLESSHPFLRKYARSISQIYDCEWVSPFYKKNRRIKAKTKNAASRYGIVQDNLFLKKNFRVPPDRSIILLDDVTTTGATLNYAARLLTENGASQKKITAVTLFIRENRIQRIPRQ